MKTVNRTIVGKGQGKKSKMFYVFEGSDPVKVKGGWKLTPTVPHIVCNASIYKQMKVGDSLL